MWANYIKLVLEQLKTIKLIIINSKVKYNVHGRINRFIVGKSNFYLSTSNVGLQMLQKPLSAIASNYKHVK